MSQTQSEAALEEQLIQALIKIGYQSVKLPTYESLVDNFRLQVFNHNKERLNHKPLSDSEFKQLRNLIGCSWRTRHPEGVCLCNFQTPTVLFTERFSKSRHDR